MSLSSNEKALFVKAADVNARIMRDRLEEKYAAFRKGLKTFVVEWGALKSLEVWTGERSLYDFYQLLTRIDEETGYPGNDVSRVCVYQLVGDSWELVASRIWRGLEMDPEEAADLSDEGRNMSEEFAGLFTPIDFGKFGYFEPWEIETPLGFMD